MEYEPGCEKYHFHETWCERHGLTWDNFLNQWGFAIGPLLFLSGVVIAAMIAFPKE